MIDQNGKNTVLAKRHLNRNWRFLLFNAVFAAGFFSPLDVYWDQRTFASE